MTAPRVPTARAAWLHGALAVAVVAAVVSVPMGPWRPGAEIAVFALGIAAVRTAVVRHRTPSAVAWRAIGAGLLLFALSCLAEVLELVGTRPALTGGLESGLDVAAYAAMAVGAVGIVRSESRRRGRGSWLDTATLVLAAALALIAVSGDGRPAGGEAFELSIGTPVLTVVLLMVCVPLALSRRHRSVTTTALLAAAALTVVGYGGRMIADTPLRELPLLNPLPLLAVAGLTLAARHPSVAAMGSPRARTRTPTGPASWASARRCSSVPPSSSSGRSGTAASGTCSGSAPRSSPGWRCGGWPPSTPTAR